MIRLADKLFAAQALSQNALAKYNLWYVVESANWAVRSVGESILGELGEQAVAPAHLTVSPWAARKGIVHFGSLPTLFTRHGLRRAHASCRTVATIFHIASDQHRAKAIKAAAYVDRLHTTTQATADQLIELGVQADRIVTIPLGVNRRLFAPVSESMKLARRQQLGISPGAIVIGSFQKDGVGWGAGREPKLEKGPDILVEALAAVNSSLPVHVLLAGPARGYVTDRLHQMGIPFTAVGFVKRLADVAALYQALDAYLISARTEGGPLSLLEAWATGIPVVTTNVGLVADHARHEQNALVSPTGKASDLGAELHRVLADPSVGRALVAQASADVRAFEWPTIAAQYYDRLYRPLIAGI